ncbi:MAG: hypothetical protein GY801_03160 [bacterium]|nr:hypothetical protein [bacterium]
MRAHDRGRSADREVCGARQVSVFGVGSSAEASGAVGGLAVGQKIAAAGMRLPFGAGVQTVMAHHLTDSVDCPPAEDRLPPAVVERSRDTYNYFSEKLYHGKVIFSFSHHCGIHHIVH